MAVKESGLLKFLIKVVDWFKNNEIRIPGILITRFLEKQMAEVIDKNTSILSSLNIFAVWKIINKCSILDNTYIIL